MPARPPGKLGVRRVWGWVCLLPLGVGQPSGSATIQPLRIGATSLEGSLMNSFNSRAVLRIDDREYEIYRLDALDKLGYNTKRLPYAQRILLENLLRREDGKNVKARRHPRAGRMGPEGRAVAGNCLHAEPRAVAGLHRRAAVVDLAAMREAMKALGGDPKKINPLQPAELVIDHSVQVDEFGSAKAFDINAELEFIRNKERYAFLRWGQTAFKNFAIVPPDTGIVHQVNVEYLARVVFVLRQGRDGQAGGLSRYAGRHRLAHDDGQRTRRARLGRRWNRSRSRHAGTAGVDADPASGRRSTERQVARRRDRHRSGADADGDAAQAWRGGQVRRVLRQRLAAPAAGGSHDDRQHGAGVWRDVRHLPGR